MKGIQHIALFCIVIMVLSLSCEDPLTPMYNNPSDINSPAYVPAAPLDLSAKIINDTVTAVNWQDKSIGEDGFKLFIKTGNDSTYGLLATINKDMKSYNDTTIKFKDTEYWYRLYSYSGEKLSKKYIETNIQFNFNAPSFTAISGTDSNQVVINWKSNTPFLTESVLEKKGNSDFEIISILPPGTSTFIDTSVKKYQTYQYRLTSRTNHNISQCSSLLRANFECSSVNFTGSTPTNVSFRNYIETSRDGSITLCKTMINSIELLDNNNKTTIRSFSFSQNISNATLSGNGQLLGVALGDSGIFNVYSTNDGHLIQSIEVTPPAIDLAITNDGAELITSSSDNIIRIWDITSGTLLRTLSGHTSSPISLSLSADGKVLISGSTNSLLLWDWQTGALLKTTEGAYFERPVFMLRDGNIYNIIYDYMKITVWNLSQNQIFSVLTAPYFTYTGYLSSDGLTLVAGGVGEFLVYNLNTKSLVQRIHNSQGANIIGWTANDTELVVADRNSDSDYSFFKLNYSWVATY